LINTGEVESFIDDVIVGIEEKERHDEVVEEIVKKLAENDFYVKLEKCKWNIKKIGFLEVIIKPEEINIEQVKVKEVLDWLTLKGVKDIQKFLGLANYYQ